MKFNHFDHFSHVSGNFAKAINKMKDDVKDTTCGPDCTDPSRLADRQVLQQRVKELELLYQLSSLLAGRADLDQILEITAAQAIQVMHAKACSIRTYDPESRELQIRAIANLSKDYLNKGPVQLDNSPIDRAALDGQAVWIEDMSNDPRVLYPRQALQEGLVSGLAVGMLYRGQPVGVIHTYTAALHKFDDFEIQCLRALASQAAAAIVNATLHQEALEAERIGRQVRLAGEVQRRMLPQRPPQIPGVDIGYVYEPCFGVSGDFYDFIPLQDNNFGVAIADVAGKGIPASLQMAYLRASLRAFAANYYEIRQIIEQLNRTLCQDSLPSEFATLFYGVLDANNGKFTYVNAGHDPPLLIRGGQLSALTVGGMVVGVDPQGQYSQEVLEVLPGDLLILYTDGLVDAMDFDQCKFGLGRLKSSILKHQQGSAQQTAKNIIWDVRRFIGLAEQNDDMSLVVIKIQ